jgi:hypothetical protein
VVLSPGSEQHDCRRLPANGKHAQILLSMDELFNERHATQISVAEAGGADRSLLYSIRAENRALPCHDSLKRNDPRYSWRRAAASRFARNGLLANRSRPCGTMNAARDGHCGGQAWVEHNIHLSLKSLLRICLELSNLLGRQTPRRELNLRRH